MPYEMAQSKARGAWLPVHFPYLYYIVWTEKKSRSIAYCEDMWTGCFKI